MADVLPGLLAMTDNTLKLFNCICFCLETSWMTLLLILVLYKIVCFSIYDALHFKFDSLYIYTFWIFMAKYITFWIWI